MSLKALNRVLGVSVCVIDPAINPVETLCHHTIIVTQKPVTLTAGVHSTLLKHTVTVGLDPRQLSINE